jgi:T5SS/PEP-CTERM-associated repeat protein
MNIHHKFIALFNATPGAFANTPSLNDTNLLLGYVQSVTGIDVTDDSDFIDHVLSNMGFVQDENADLWDTAHGAMTGLVSANGRASAVDTAIQFLETVGQDPSSDYYRPAYRLIQKAEGSVVATEANNTETDPEVLKAIFAETDYGWLNDLGVLSDNNTVLTVDHRLTISDAENSAITPFGDSYDTVDVEGSLLLGSVDTINAARLRYENSHLVQNKTINLDGGGTTHIAPVDTFAVMAKFENSTLNFLDGGANFSVGNGNSDDDPSDTDPLAILKLVNSTLSGSSDDNDLFIAMLEGGNGLAQFSNSQINGFNDIRVGFGNSDNAQTSNGPIGLLSLDNSTLSITGHLVSGQYGGIGNIQLGSVSGTIGGGLHSGVTNEVVTESEGDITISNDSNLTVSDWVLVGNGKGTTGNLAMANSSLTTTGRGIIVGENYAPNWESVTGNQEAVGTVSLVASSVIMDSSIYNPSLDVGTGDYASGTVTLTGSTISGGQSLFVGIDDESSATPNLGGEGLISLSQQSGISLETTARPSYFAVGGWGGTGSIILDASSFTQISSGQASENEFAGAYYSGAHIGRSDSSLVTGNGFEGTFTLQNGSTAAQTSTATSNVNPYLTVGRDDGASGKLEILSGSSWTLSASNPELVYNGLTLGNSAGSTGTVLVDGSGSELMVAGSAARQVIIVGSDGDGEMRVTNGGQVHLHTTRSSGGEQVGQLIVGEFSNGSGTLVIDGSSSLVMGDQLAQMSIGEMPEGMYSGSNTADSYAGATGIVTIANGGSLQMGIAGDGIPDIFVGNGGSLIASDDSTVVGDIQIIGTGTVSDNLLSLVI